MFWPTLVLAIQGILSAEPACVELSVIHTASMVQREAVADEGGSWLKKRPMTIAAVVLRRPGSGDVWLFDAGLSENIDDQMREAPWWFRAVMSGRRAGRSAVEQLGAGVSNLRGIILSHLHWDHVSGVSDFKGVPVYARSEELEWAGRMKPGEHGVVPGMIRAVGAAFLPLTMEPLDGLDPFTKGRDFLSDGSLLLIAVAGHTPGSLMLLAKGCDSRNWLFIGDEAWLGSAVRAARGKPWFVRWVADVEHGLLIEEIKQIAEMARRLDARVVPAHDMSAYEDLPEYLGFH